MIESISEIELPEDAEYELTKISDNIGFIAKGESFRGLLYYNTIKVGRRCYVGMANISAITKIEIFDFKTLLLHTVNGSVYELEMLEDEEAEKI